MRLHRDAKVDLIRAIPLFASCSAEELARVAGIADEIDLREGRQLTTEDARGQEVVILVEGTAEVRRDGEVVNTMGPGQCIGEVALVTGQPRTATVLATSPVHALVIEGHAFRSLLAESPDIRVKVERAAARHLARDAEQD
jgi:CRP/FNR family transcriptional regulator, cyclic AMP receptor protein